MRAHDEHGNRVFRKAPRSVDPGSPSEDEGESSAERDAIGLASEPEERLGERVFHVRLQALEQLQVRIQALGRRAHRIGLEPVRLIDTGERDVDGRALVVLSGHAPVLAGWTLAAIVEHRDGRAAVRPVSEHGERLGPDAFAAATCEHCLLRRWRSRTYVVVHGETGELRQVGSGCLRDFVGGHDPERACRRAEQLALVRAELERAAGPVLGGSSADRSEPTLAQYAAHAARVVRAQGFVSREQARRTSRPASADEALRSLEEASGAPDRADRALADGALRWARGLLATKFEPSRFERDALTVVSGRRILTPRDRGLVCALIAAYRQRRARSRHLARPGANIEVTVLVERVTARRSARHDTVRRCELIDVEANRLVWWQTQGVALRTGEVVTLIGRAQRHTRFGATPVTVLSHCRRAR